MLELTEPPTSPRQSNGMEDAYTFNDDECGNIGDKKWSYVRDNNVESDFGTTLNSKYDTKLI